MPTRRVDVVILGAGTAGLNARREVERQGRSWVLVDPGPYGTTCARVGCMPSKLLIAAAEAAHAARHAHAFGVRVDGVHVDGPAVLARVRSERDRFAGFVARELEALSPDALLRERGRLLGPTTVQAGDTRLEAQAVVLATGSSPWIPPGYDAVRDRVLVSDDVFAFEDLPRRLAVLGAGIIGLELGQALRRLGVHVEVFDPADKVLGIADPRVAETAHDVLSQTLPIHLGSRVTEARPDGDGVHLSWTAADGAAHEATFDRVLAAAGRRPNLEGLGLDTLGVPADRRGLPTVDPYTMQVGDLPVFLAGDVTADKPLLHEAADEGRIAGANAARFPDVVHGARREPLAIAFTEPQLAVVGPSFDTFDPEHLAVGEVSFANQGRARVMDRAQGVARIYADARSCRIVGATLFGPRMEHMGHLLAWAVAEGMTVDTALTRPFYHPVLEEGLRTALRDLAKSLRLVGRCRPEDLSEGPGS